MRFVRGTYLVLSLHFILEKPLPLGLLPLSQIHCAWAVRQRLTGRVIVQCRGDCAQLPVPLDELRLEEALPDAAGARGRRVLPVNIPPGGECECTTGGVGVGRRLEQAALDDWRIDRR